MAQSKLAEIVLRLVKVPSHLCIAARVSYGQPLEL